MGIWDLRPFCLSPWTFRVRDNMRYLAFRVYGIGFRVIVPLK